MRVVLLSNAMSEKEPKNRLLYVAACRLHFVSFVPVLLILILFRVHTGMSFMQLLVLTTN